MTVIKLNRSNKTLSIVKSKRNIKLVQEKHNVNLNQVGRKGPQGDQGEPGVQGPQGIPGPKGETGAQGIPGQTGSQGPKGDRGDDGPQGPKGDTGDQGPIGQTGPKGEQGEPGQDGIAGPGVASGGTSGQYLKKDSATDYDTSWATLDKASVGLSNVDNTSDANKPISNATQTALNLKANISSLAAVALSGAYSDLTGAPNLSGYVTGPASSVDNAVARYDGTTGKVIQNSGVYISDGNRVSINGTLATRQLNIQGEGSVAGLHIDRTDAGTAISAYSFFSSSSFWRAYTSNNFGFSWWPNSIERFRISPTDVGTVDVASSGPGFQSLASNRYVQSRGEGLVTNGTGLLMNNYNFSGFTFDPAVNYNGGGSFRNATMGAITRTDELIPVDPYSYYNISVTAIASTYVAGANAYFGMECFDIDGLSILPNHSSIVAGSARTTLAQPLNPGDTTVTLTDATGWHNGASAASRIFNWYGYTNGAGYTYPNYTYTRNSLTGAWAQGGISGNVITLSVPWAGPALAAGRAVANGQSGGTFLYMPSANNVNIPATWTSYSDVMGNLNTDNSVNDPTRFRYGTAYIKILFLMNRDVAGNVTNVANIQFNKMNDEAAKTITVSTNYTVRSIIETIFAAPSLSRTITLPDATLFTGRKIHVKRITGGAQTLRLITVLSQTIDGAADYPLNNQYMYVTVQSDGLNWYVRSNN